MTAKIHEHVEKPPDFIADSLDCQSVARYSWSDFRVVPCARELLSQKAWEELEGEVKRSTRPIRSLPDRQKRDTRTAIFTSLSLRG